VIEFGFVDWFVGFDAILGRWLNMILVDNSRPSISYYYSHQRKGGKELTRKV